jgi:hypothetical protein
LMVGQQALHVISFPFEFQSLILMSASCTLSATP